MKVEVKLFAILAAFYGLMGIIYWWWTAVHTQDGTEHVGVVGLFLTAGMCAMIGGYAFITARKLDARPDDDPLGEIADVEGEYGFFAPYSWWPLYLGLSCAVVFFGVAVGWWLVILGMPMVALSTLGWSFEYFRGENAV